MLTCIMAASRATFLSWLVSPFDGGDRFTAVLSAGPIDSLLSVPFSFSRAWRDFTHNSFPSVSSFRMVNGFAG